MQYVIRCNLALFANIHISEAISEDLPPPLQSVTFVLCTCSLFHQIESSHGAANGLALWCG